MKFNLWRYYIVLAISSCSYLPMFAASTTSSSSSSQLQRGRKRGRSQDEVSGVKRQRSVEQEMIRFDAQDGSFVLLPIKELQQLYDFFIEANKSPLKTADGFYEQLRHVQTLPNNMNKLQQIASQVARISVNNKNLDGVRFAILKKQLMRSDGVIAQAFFSPGEQLQEIILELIKAEKKHIRVACYMLTSKKILCELARAHRRGVRVQIVVDLNDAKDHDINAMREAGLYTWVWRRRWFDTKPKMHNKFFVFEQNINDQPLLVTGSANCTWRAQNVNEENIVVINNQDVINQFVHRFNRQLMARSFTQYVEPVGRQESLEFISNDCLGLGHWSLSQFIANALKLREALGRLSAVNIRRHREGLLAQPAQLTSDKKNLSDAGHASSSSSTSLSDGVSSSSSAAIDDGMVTVALSGRNMVLQKEVLKQIPYFQILLDPVNFIDRHYGLNVDYDVLSDEESMSLMPYRKLRDALIEAAQKVDHFTLSLAKEDIRSFVVLYNILAKIHLHKINTFDDLLNVLKSSSVFKPEHVAMTTRVLEALFSQRGVDSALNQIEKFFWSHKLAPSENSDIMHAFFSPADNIEPLIVSLINIEQESILLASYRINNQKIVDALRKARERGVKIEVILDQGSRDGLAQLHQAGLPRCVWPNSRFIQGQQVPFMHDKFILFSKSIYDNPLLLNGSANMTREAQDNNEESIIVTSDNRLIMQFMDRFFHLKRNSECFVPERPALLQPSALNMSEFYKEGAFLMKGIVRLYAQYILDGKFKMEDVPMFIKPDVEQYVSGIIGID